MAHTYARDVPETFAGTAQVIDQTLGQYHLIDELGKGGFATVYRALQPTLNRHVAIKVLHPEFIRDERALARFKREALAVARLAHPNIVAVYDYGEHDGRAYLVMEYVSGDTLKVRLGKPVSNELALGVIKAVGAALDYAHSKGLIHRDIKPGNILFTEDDRIVLSDFGIVRLADDESDLTRGVIGTPQYMSPEQALGREVDARSDLYSLGVVLFELLTGRVPFKGENAISTLSMHATVPVPSARSLNENVTEAVDRVVQKSLAKAPEQRYGSCHELADALAAAFAEAERPPEPTILVSTTTGPVAPAPLPTPGDLESMYRHLLTLTRAQDWRSAVSLAADILAIDPNFRDVSAILASASNELRFGRTDSSVNMQVANFMAEADTARAAGRLVEAASILQQVLRLSSSNTEARMRLDEISRQLAEQEAERRRRARLDELYTLAQSKIRSGDLQWAYHILEEITAMDAAFRDVSALMAQVRQALGPTDRSIRGETPGSRVIRLRDEAEAAMAQEHWGEAVALFEEVLGLEPELDGITERLETARHQASMASLNAEVAQLVGEGRFEEAILKMEELKQLTGR